MGGLGSRGVCVHVFNFLVKYRKLCLHLHAILILNKKLQGEQNSNFIIVLCQIHFWLLTFAAVVS